MTSGAGAEARGRAPGSPRFVVLVDYMEVMGWVEVDVFARDASDTVRRITPRGLAVLREA